MKRSFKIMIVLSCIVLIVCSFYYGYFATTAKIKRSEAEEKPRTRVDNKFHPTSKVEEVNKIPSEDIVTPNTRLFIKIIAVNTGNSTVDYDDVVPDYLVNRNKKEIEEFFKNSKSVDFSVDKITVIKELPYLPNKFLVKLDKDYIRVFRTDNDGIATEYEGFEPIYHKNIDELLVHGIEVETEEEVQKVIIDYE